MKRPPLPIDKTKPLWMQEVKPSGPPTMGRSAKRKLTDDEVRQIRLTDKDLIAYLARVMELPYNVVYAVKMGKTHRHVV